MSTILRTSCVCGWETKGSEDEVVAATLDHGLRVHNMAGTREQVLERAERLDAEPAAEQARDDEPSPQPEPTARVVDNPARSRYEIVVGDQVVGFTNYDLAGDRITLNHTEIDPSVEGRGYGSRLASAALKMARDRGSRIVVTCPFITAYVRRHQADYPDIDLLAGKVRIGRTG
jgi:predicted GNAT family acetyltransferase